MFGLHVQNTAKAKVMLKFKDFHIHKLYYINAYNRCALHSMSSLHLSDHHVSYKMYNAVIAQRKRHK